MKYEIVKQEQIQLVIDGFQKSHQHFVETKAFNTVDFKNFMEPIFKEAGYRTDAKKMGVGTNILIIHDAGVGDFILMSPAIREIRRIYEKAHITLVLFPRALNLAETCPYVDEILSNVRQCNWFSFAENYLWNVGIAKRLLERRYDIAFAFTHYDCTPLLAYMSGAKERISFQFEPDAFVAGSVPCNIMSTLMTLEVPQQKYGKHAVDVALAFLDNMLRMPVANRELEIWYTPFDFTLAYELLKPYNDKKIYALCMGGSSSFKFLPIEKYAEFVEHVLKTESDAIFVIIGGGKTDETNAEQFINLLKSSNLNDRVLNLVSKITFRQSAAILNLCDMYIGNDTSMLHAAATAKLPSLAVFCFPADIKITNESVIGQCYPYHVPSVVVQPRHALPECKDSKDIYGCKIHDKPHCITTIPVEAMIIGFDKLKEQIAKHATTPIFIN